MLPKSERLHCNPSFDTKLITEQRLYWWYIRERKALRNLIQNKLNEQIKPKNLAVASKITNAFFLCPSDPTLELCPTDTTVHVWNYMFKFIWCNIVYNSKRLDTIQVFSIKGLDHKLRKALRKFSQMKTCPLTCV